MDKALAMFTGYVIAGAITGLLLGNRGAQHRINRYKDQLALRMKPSPKPKPGLLIEGEYVRVS